MRWIALQPAREDERAAWGWRALQFTPRVALVHEAVLLEVAASERLFGGLQALLERLFEPNLPLAGAKYRWAATSLIALALLRLQLRGQPPPPRVPEGLPLALLDAALPHEPVLARAGIRTWGALAALPRAALARRFGPALLDALDAAWGHRPESYPWLQLPPVFDMGLELPHTAASAPELLWTARRLLAQLQVWLQARQLGVLALRLEWTLDLRRLDGRALPPTEWLDLRTAEPAQDMAHLLRLLAERLARTPMAAPANRLQLQSLQTAPWQPASRSFLPGQAEDGERLHQLVERLSARLGAANVLRPHPQADWRPERMQAWRPAGGATATTTAAAIEPPHTSALLPTWLLPRPLRLPVQDDRPWHGRAPLALLTRARRIETGWWEPQGAVVRDDWIARSQSAGLVWVSCEHVPAGAAGRQACWWLQGVYA